MTITQPTAAAIWTAYREIETGKKLLQELQQRIKDGDENPNPRDPFGNQRPYQLGVPNDSNGHRLFDVAPRLAASIIRAHIAEKETELLQANEQARIELETKP